MTTPTYLVINFINGTECVDECDTLEEAREFAEEHGGKVVKAENYSPQDDGRAPLDEDAYLEKPWIVDGWASKAEWLYAG
ncbi:hypothetical protein [uncultured Bilophila sp.]|jgi:hypothetical protein|uniref:hypothetical protein n=1 Tax=uncultured Bilophila sp. TaxID=529385 RepID=UPI0025EC08D0|nr:hypothetical protein [uncultured Bilophila sp.]